MNKVLTLNFFIELGASVFTVLGLYFGSSELLGASLYAISLIFWYMLAIRQKLWGLMPLNVASTIVTGINLFAVLSK